MDRGRKLYNHVQVDLQQNIVQVQQVQADLEQNQLAAMRKRWFVEDHSGQPHLWEDDRTVAEWLVGQINPDSKSVSQVKYFRIGFL